MEEEAVLDNQYDNYHEFALNQGWSCFKEGGEGDYSGGIKWYNLKKMLLISSSSNSRKSSSPPDNTKMATGQVYR